MTLESAVLALGGDDTYAWNLAARASRLGFRVVRSKTPEDAIALRAERGFRFGACLIDSAFPATALSDALQMMRMRLEAPDLGFIAVGESADRETRQRLHEGGVELTLWEPIGDNTLRFQLNRALANIHPNLIRGEHRVPTDWRALVYSGGREKPVGVYSISSGGAFLATAQPSMSGAEIALELPLPTGRITLDGRVIYTNVPGNLKSPKLPNGMAVRFNASQGPEVDAIRALIADQAASLSL
jgi:hypothetical protein